jgi:Ca-activated chloride channel family protein
MTLVHPYLWWLVPASIVAVWLVRLLSRRRAVAFTRLALFNDSEFRASRFRYLPNVVLWMAMTMVVFALMGPQVRTAAQEVEAKGLDIVLVIDLSISMLGPIGVTGEVSGPWVPPPPGASRMDATKEALRTFINLRRDDRIGIVVFSDNAYIVCPLTFDREHLLNYFDLLDPTTLPGESLTAIGEGITAGTSLLMRQSAPKVLNKVMVVFTDGANNAGRDPVEATKEATMAGIRVHVVGIDLEAEMTRSPQVPRLVNTVKGYGGRYFAASSEFDLSGASHALDEIEKGFLTTRTRSYEEPVDRWFALAAFALLGLAFMLRALPLFVPLH